MEKGLIKLASRQVINNTTNNNAFEKALINTSYKEFLLKSQVYNKDKQFKTFKEMVAADGKANSLHYKLNFSIGNIIHLLNKKIPKVCDESGKQLEFDVNQFELIDSDITNIAAHSIAITYLTATYTLFGTLGEYLILASGDKLFDVCNQPIETFTLKTQPGLSIVEYRAAPFINVESLS